MAINGWQVHLQETHLHIAYVLDEMFSFYPLAYQRQIQKSPS